MTNNVYENDTYVVYIGAASDNDIGNYLVINKITNVTEVITSMLPEAIELAMSLEDALRQLLHDHDDDENIVGWEDSSVTLQ